MCKMLPTAVESTAIKAEKHQDIIMQPKKNIYTTVQAMTFTLHLKLEMQYKKNNLHVERKTT